MRFLKGLALVSVTLFFAVLMLGVLSLRVQPVRGGVAGATKNGDMNCDDKIDIADAVNMLEWLFKGGPAPCALAQEEGVLEKLNALGEQITALQSSVAI